MITKITIFDFDGTLSNSPKPEDGIQQWEKTKGVNFTHDDWWGRPESLDTNVFNIKLFTNIVNILKKEQSNKDTLVIVLSARIEKLRPYIKNILKRNNVSVRSLELKSDERSKGEKILNFIDKFPALEKIDVYDDRDKEIKSYLSIKNQIPSNIEFNIFVANNGTVNKINDSNVINENKIINESMTQISLRYKPKFLPQVSAPYSEVIKGLTEENVVYEVTTMNPNDLKVIQGITLSHNVHKSNLDSENPIYISNTNDVCDGNHRVVKSLYKNHDSIRCVKVDLPTKDACRILNKIQDLFDHKKKKEEDDENNMPFLDRIEIPKITTEDDEKKETTKIIGYRSVPINPNSVVGNFFSLKPKSGAKKYEIEFDNLLDTNSLGLTFMSGQVPVDILAKTWFPHIDFEKLATDNNTEAIKVKNRAVAEKAKKMGYDGILYGDKIVQGL